jgi:hypothetical protein
MERNPVMVKCERLKLKLLKDEMTNEFLSRCKIPHRSKSSTEECDDRYLICEVMEKVPPAVYFQLDDLVWGTGLPAARVARIIRELTSSGRAVERGIRRFSQSWRLLTEEERDAAQKEERLRKRPNAQILQFPVKRKRVKLYD